MKKNKLICATACMISSIASATATYFILNKRVSKEDNKSVNKKMNKFKQYYQLTNQWLLLKNMNKSIPEYFDLQGYQSIAIYGMGELGNRLYEELMNSKIEVKYAIDKYPENNFTELKFCELSDNMEEVDVIIVTPVFDYEEIEKNITSKVNYKVISLEDILWDM